MKPKFATVRPKRRPRFDPRRSTVIFFAALLPAALLAWGVTASVRGGSDGPTKKDPAPVRVEIAGEIMLIPGNLIRFHSTRDNGAEQVDLLLKWPGLEAYSDSFNGSLDGADGTPLLHASIGTRDNPYDSDAMLEPLYSQFFAEEASDSPEGLTGRVMAANSAYGGEVIYFSREGEPRFVTRCLSSRNEVADTCMRTVNIGSRLSLLYRFNRAYLADWRGIDSGLKKLVAEFLAAG